jgi:RNA polymerase sigma-70 factor (ECF subfamily)
MTSTTIGPTGSRGRYVVTTAAPKKPSKRPSSRSGRPAKSYEQQRGKVAAWVLTIARHRAIDIARRNAPHAAHRASDERLHTLPAPSNVSELVAGRAEAHDLLGLLAQLPDAQREVITLAFYGQLTHTEIAEHLHLPAGTVKGRMRLGLQRLRGDIDRVAS